MWPFFLEDTQEDYCFLFKKVKESPDSMFKEIETFEQLLKNEKELSEEEAIQAF